MCSRDSGDEASTDASAGLSCRDLSFSYGNTPVFEGVDADFLDGGLTGLERQEVETPLVVVLTPVVVREPHVDV